MFFNGTLVLHSGKLYVFTVTHGVVVNPLGLELLLHATDPLVWTELYHFGAEYNRAADSRNHVIHDCAVFLLEFNEDLVNMAVRIFLPSPGKPFPSTRAVGVGYGVDDLDTTCFTPVVIDDRFSGYNYEKGYAYLKGAWSEVGLSGTGITDKKNRFVGVMSGNLPRRGTSGEYAVIVLTSRFLTLLDASTVGREVVVNTQQ